MNKETYASLRPVCNASNQNFYSYGGGAKVQDGFVSSCPVCGKTIKLMAKYRKTRLEPARSFQMIPRHHIARAVAVQPT